MLFSILVSLTFVRVTASITYILAKVLLFLILVIVSQENHLKKKIATKKLNHYDLYSPIIKKKVVTINK